MKKLVGSILFIIFLEFFMVRCANPGTISGGPKDTIPPKLLQSDPVDQTLNFNGQTITLTFDEMVSANKLKQSLIITPITEIKYKHIAKKQTVTLKFDSPFADSTTYTLNFFDGITDITEQNPAENLVIAFSTGDYIDSLELYGNVKDLFSNQPIEKMTVGIYRITDSLDIFQTKPTYFINTDEYGVFRIQNIKQSNYRLIAFKDENRNLLFDAKEIYSFLSDTLFLTESIADSIYLKAIQINASPLKLISGRPTTKYFEIRYSKPITNYELHDSLPGSKFATDFTGEMESIRFYNNLNLQPEDSVYTILTVYDSLKNSTTDTLYVKFRESTRKPAEFSSSLRPTGSTPIFSDSRFSLKFTKPVELIDSSFMYMRIDTLYRISLTTVGLESNFNQTAYSFSIPEVNKSFITDTLEAFQNAVIGDSTDVDSTDLILYNKIKNYPRSKFELVVEPASFLSVENDTSKAINTVYTFGNPQNFGIIRIKVNSTYPAYFVQLMKGKDVYAVRSNCNECLFNRISPGDYWVRILIDEDQDGQWSVGNILNNIEPEPAIYYPEKTSIRANWENELQISF